ncbi:MAG: hypothetical protein JWN75_348 [Candidatus Saccharibacteria bacterium]|nr:hypothetical protein [Candidatus Saccharibacteria bacterium]
MDHQQSLTRMAVLATLHCLTGCAIGEILGMVLGVIWNLSNFATVLLSVLLAFLFGYLLSLRSILKSGVPLRQALTIVLAADTLSILTMEIIDNLFILVVPGAIDAQLIDALFWLTLFGSLLVAFIVTVPVNRWLIARGKGHALMHHH